jgi:hypothetical protein
MKACEDCGADTSLGDHERGRSCVAILKAKVAELERKSKNLDEAVQTARDKMLREVPPFSRLVTANTRYRAILDELDLLAFKARAAQSDKDKQETREEFTKRALELMLEYANPSAKPSITKDA